MVLHPLKSLCGAMLSILQKPCTLFFGNHTNIKRNRLKSVGVWTSSQVHLCRTVIWRSKLGSKQNNSKNVLFTSEELTVVVMESWMYLSIFSHFNIYTDPLFYHIVFCEYRIFVGLGCLNSSSCAKTPLVQPSLYIIFGQIYGKNHRFWLTKDYIQSMEKSMVDFGSNPPCDLWSLPLWITEAQDQNGCMWRSI